VNFRRTRAVARKEFRHILRDSRSLIMALALPFVMLMLFGYALSLDVDRISTLIFDQDGSPESRELVARIEADARICVPQHDCVVTAEFAPAMFQEIEKRSFTYRNTRTRIEKATLGSDAGLYGAAYLPLMSR